MTPLPSVTVLLSVFNGGAHLAEAIASVLAQTHADFELLIIDDGSTDDTPAVLRSFTDPRIRVVTQPNAGLVAALNRGLGEARHDLVARMDADDVSSPHRLERQTRFLVENPTVAAVGSCFDLIDEAGGRTGVAHVAADSGYLGRQLYFRNTLAHTSILMRRDAVLEVGAYRQVGPVEDYDLWTRLAGYYPLVALDDVLVSYRVSPSGISASAGSEQQLCLDHVRRGLHGSRPYSAVSPARVVREGSLHRRSHPRCTDTAASYLLDHLGLAVVLWSYGRRGVALVTASGAALFVLRHPTSVRGVAASQAPKLFARLRARLTLPAGRPPRSSREST